MIFVSEAKTTAPDEYRTALQEKVYRVLAELNIPFERVDTDEAITMEDCLRINERLDMKTVKTLFLCNRQQTNFYLLITPGDKPFKTRDFSDAMQISRVSFAPAGLMESMLGTKVGSATIFSVLLDTAKEVRIVLDSDVLKDEWYGCSDGTTTGYMKLRTAQVMDSFLPFAKRTPTIISCRKRY